MVFHTKNMKNGFQKSSVYQFTYLLLAGIIILLFGQACDQAEDSKKNGSGPCGKFKCLTQKALPEFLGAEYKLAFQFQPADCGKNCLCDKIAYIQIARVVLHDGTYWDDGNHTDLVVTGIKNGGEDSLELNGWFIDTWLDAKYGYYARYSNGKFDNELVGLGQNRKTPELPAWLFDRPKDLKKDSLVEFIDAPVCIDTAASCSDKLLGYSHWWFTIGNDGNPPSIEGPDFELDPKGNRLKVLKQAVDLAIKSWNQNASSKGPHEVERFSDNTIALN
jgi:hypothetical protein